MNLTYVVLHIIFHSSFQSNTAFKTPLLHASTSVYNLDIYLET